MPPSSKFLAESTGEKIVNIDQYLAKIWTKCNSLLFLAHPVYLGSIYQFYACAEFHHRYIGILFGSSDKRILGHVLESRHHMASQDSTAVFCCWI